MNGTGLSRRHLVFAGMAMVLATAGGEAAAASPAVRYMHKVANDLMAAQRDGRVAAYYAVINRHADVPSIAMYSLGQYRSQLANAKRAGYFKGVAGFMARYFADQSRSYVVVKADISPNTRQDGENVLVDTRLTLASGATYTVVWRLAPRRSGYKVVDVRVLGFSLTYLQRSIFLSYINRKGGDVNALVAALMR